MGGDHVHIAFDDHGRSGFPDGFRSQIQAVQDSAFIKRRRLRGIHVFGGIVPQGATAKPDDVAAPVEYRKHQPVSKYVVDSALAVAGEAGAAQGVVVVPQFLHVGAEGIPGIRCVSDLE